MSFLRADKARFARYGVPEATISSKTRTTSLRAICVERLGEQALKLPQEPLGLLPASVLRFRVKLNEQRYCFAEGEGRGLLRIAKHAQLSVANDLPRFGARLG